MIASRRIGVAPTVREVFAYIGRRPLQGFILRWNWKTAAFGAIIRGAIYFFTSLKGGWRAGLFAMSIEASWRLPLTGFCGAFTQAFRNARPRWVATVLVAGVLPALMHCIEFVVHWSHRPPRLWLSFSVSVSVTILGALFNLYAMRRGVYVVGHEGRSFAADLRRTPVMLAGFIISGPAAAFRALRAALIGIPVRG